MKLKALLFLCLGVLAPPMTESRAEFPDSLREGESGWVAEVIDGDTLRLEDGREIRMIGLQAPKLPLGRPGFTAWPLAEEARETLAGLADGRSLRVGFGGTAMDRYGRVLAQLFDAQTGRWLQGEMLRVGMARVYSFEDNRALLDEMLEIERAAREARRGIWAHPNYQIRSAGEAGRYIGRYELVEGLVLDAEVRGRLGFLNFGRNYRTDFTITLDRAALRRFAEEGMAPDDYIGLRIRTRGWLRLWNGPMIEVTHPEQIEVLGK